MEMSSLVSTLPDIMVMLPQIIYLSQMVFYLFFIFFFGSMAMRGCRVRWSFMVKFPATFLAGSFCLVGGVSFAGFVPFFGDGFMRVFQIDVLIAGFAVSVLLAIALRLITRGHAAKSSKEVIERLKRKVSVLQEMLMKKAGHITEADAKRIAIKAMHGYEADGVKLIGNEFEVSLKKGDRTGKVIIDIWDGEIRKKVMKEHEIMQFFRDVHKVAGLVIIIAILVGAAVFFEGLPDPGEGFTSMLGVSPEEISDLASSLKGNPFMPENLPEGCVTSLIFSVYSAQLQDPDFLADHAYDDESVKATIRQNAGEEVRMMLRVDHNGKDVILGFTAGGKYCYLTDGTFCACMESPASA